MPPFRSRRWLDTDKTPADPPRHGIEEYGDNRVSSYRYEPQVRSHLAPRLVGTGFAFAIFFRMEGFGRCFSGGGFPVAKAARTKVSKSNEAASTCGVDSR
jgi:hypothetical protein